jgi:hypothetical protein
MSKDKHAPALEIQGQAQELADMISLAMLSAAAAEGREPGPENIRDGLQALLSTAWTLSLRVHPDEAVARQAYVKLLRAHADAIEEGSPPPMTEH